MYLFLKFVSEPDIRSGAEARAYVEKLRSILQYLEVSDGRMEEGSLRGDCNVSVRLRGTKEFGTRTETKNVNSLTAIQKVVEYEALRQAKLIEAGGKVDQETRTWMMLKALLLVCVKRRRKRLPLLP